ncbi:MAG TPA: protein-export chaperone SecB [Stellaceae bacterium]|jgi:preprotein translocase subunit SecB|nr:protein-export chaperone SecB [Stellaceae bacterium]
MSSSDNGANAPGDAGGAAAAGARHITINAQYIKDMSFENPGAPGSLLQPQPPELQLSMDVNAGGLAPDNYEVVLAIRAAARSAKGDILFMLELAYAAAVTLTNVAESSVPDALLVETPRLIFPFARALVAEITRDGGYPPMLLPIVDFRELLRRRQDEAAKQAAAAPKS